MDAPIFEIHDYHYRTDRMDEYREWAHDATPILGDRLDVLGFWVDNGIPGRPRAQTRWNFVMAQPTSPG